MKQTLKIKVTRKDAAKIDENEIGHSTKSLQQHQSNNERNRKQNFLNHKYYKTKSSKFF